MPKLALIQMDSYREDDLYNGFCAAFQALGLAGCFRPSEKILIKPNLLSAVTPDKAVTPHPAVFEALIRCLQNENLLLSYGDSPALDSTERAVRLSGLAEIAESRGVGLADFSNTVETALPDGKLLRQLPLAAGVAAADGLVSLAKLKTHALTGMTGVLKNQFGVIPGQRKAVYHANFPALENFSQMLVDINTFLKPRLYVMDGIIAMEGNGPRNGKPRQVGVILLSTDPVAVDAAGSCLMGIAPDSIQTTRLAAAQGLGEINLEVVDTCLIQPLNGQLAIQHGNAGQFLKALQVKGFAKPNITHAVFKAATAMGGPIFKKHIQRRPVIKSGQCICCGICETACPLTPPAVRQTGKDKIPTFDYARCIRCFCCQEVCPAGAVESRQTLIGRLFKG